MQVVVLRRLQVRALLEEGEAVLRSRRCQSQLPTQDQHSWGNIDRRACIATVAQAANLGEASILGASNVALVAERIARNDVRARTTTPG